MKKQYHPTKLKGNGSLKKLAREITNLRYDQTASFIEELADSFRRRAERDSKRHRPMLALRLYDISDKLYEAKDDANKAWKICRPYMRR